MTVADDSSEEHGHHLPAVEDWPRGFGEASWWPFVTALGASGIYVGAALFLLAQGQDGLVDSIYGPVVFVGAVGLFLAGLYGWVYHAFVKAFWAGGGHGDGIGLRWGMVLFLISEIATFGAGFVYYFFIRVGSWTTEGFPHLVSSLVLVNTAILVLSSATLHWGHVELRKGNRRNFLVGLAATLLLGVVFIGGQVLEYYEFIIHSDFTLTSGIYASAFYGLTGLHGLHVSMGAVLLAVVFIRALYGQYTADRHVSVTTVSMYWHFVDAVWIFLVVVLYVGAETAIF